MMASTDRSIPRVMITIASPTAATAMIAARVATWLKLDTERNCGAMSDTPAPSTNMIATRLSSRWRPIAMSHR